MVAGASASDAQRILRATRASLASPVGAPAGRTHGVIEAVLFDWGDTLMPYDAQADDAFVLARTQAGLAALDGRAEVDPEAITAWFREHFDELFASDAEED